MQGCVRQGVHALWQGFMSSRACKLSGWVTAQGKMLSVIGVWPGSRAEGCRAVVRCTGNGQQSLLSPQSFSPARASIKDQLSGIWRPRRAQACRRCCSGVYSFRSHIVPRHGYQCFHSTAHRSTRTLLHPCTPVPALPQLGQIGALPHPPSLARLCPPPAAAAGPPHPAAAHHHSSHLLCRKLQSRWQLAKYLTKGRVGVRPHEQQSAQGP